jgi:hypothetical protein
MVAILTFIGIAIFFVGAYYMGNGVLHTFDEDLEERIINTLFGILCWFGIAACLAICFLIYWMVSCLVLHC